MRTFVLATLLLSSACYAGDNQLTAEERKAGWIVLFDGKTLNGWQTSSLKPSKTPVEEGAINPHKCGGYMMVHETQWADFILSIDFKISKGCNSGIFLRTFPLRPLKKGWGLGYNGIEMQILDSTGAGIHDTGAIYDLIPPKKNAMKPAGEWNHAVLTCKGSKITIELNGEVVNRMDLDEWDLPGKRPDGTEHKYTGIVWKDHVRNGYIGLQDHGSPCWFKNIKIKPLSENRASTQPSK